jgi:pyruvate dehydrogenase E1 component beta subunit
VVREGDAATLIGYGGMVEVCEKAAAVAEKEGVRLEVIDVETLAPFDTETVLASVRKTGRAVVVYEAMRTGGFGAEIAARLAEGAIDALQAPVLRVAGWDAPYPPFSSLEHHYRPNAKRVLEAVEKVLRF